MKRVHWTSMCPQLPTAFDRLRRARKLRLCLMCLRKDHDFSSAECRGQPTECRFCRRAVHHKALCPAYIRCILIVSSRRTTGLPVPRRLSRTAGIRLHDRKRAGAIPEREGPRKRRAAAPAAAVLAQDVSSTRGNPPLYPRQTRSQAWPRTKLRLQLRSQPSG